jgi:murein DD-endopeptidase MepM/ murein hydrolase activator NlpD
MSFCVIESVRIPTNLTSRIGFLLAAAFLASPLMAGERPRTPNDLPAQRSVRITTEREGERTHFYVSNDELCEITMTFEMGLINLASEEHCFPYTGTFPGGKKTRAFTLAPVVPGKDWKFTYTNYYKLGDHQAQHDKNAVYELPYQSGKKYKVTQSANGSFSHHGSNLYAVDWKMPVGTPVCAARDGVVVKLKKDSNKGGPNMSYDKYNNYVLVRHADGTLGHYCHLSRGSITVKPGDQVTAGQAIAASGNTGFSSGPHLHFAVFVTRDGKRRESVPLKFRTAEGTALDLVAGRSYEAAPLQTAAAEPRAATGG